MRSGVVDVISSLSERVEFIGDRPNRLQLGAK